MRNYYNNALVTIAASKASATTDGFLEKHSPHHDSPEPACTRKRVVSFYSPSGQVGSILLEMNPQIYDPLKEPLNKRCWTAQERLLSPRILLFPSVGGFALQCQREENYRGRIYYHHMILDGRQRLFQPLSLFQGKKKVEVDAQSIHDSWLSTVTDYGRRRITHPGDKLIAIAALAEEYYQQHAAWLGKYYAGHWEHFLAQSMHWFVSLHENRPAPLLPRAPSWSWASVDGAHYSPVVPDDSGKYESFFEVLSASTTLVTTELPFAGVKSGCLRLKCSTMELWWCRQYDGNITLQMGGDSSPLGQAYPDVVENCPSGTDKVIFMPLARYVERTPTPTETMYGLLLATNPTTIATHRRIGYAYIFRQAQLILDACKASTATIA